MNILVTGSTGFVGSQLCRALAVQGHTVRAFHRPSSLTRLLEGLPVEHAIGDLTQPETLIPALEGIEVVFHAAAWMGGSHQPGKQYAVTVEGTRSLLQAALKAGVRRFVHTSSAAALGVPRLPADARMPTAPIDEQHTWNFRPEWYPYGYAKYLAELEVQKAVAQGLDAVIVNPTLIFGAGDQYRQSSSLVNQIARRRLSVAIEGGVNIIHLQDVISGHLCALERGKTGERYLLGNENRSFFDLFRLIAKVTRVPPPNLILPNRLVHLFAAPAGWFSRFIDLPTSPETLHLAGAFFYYDCTKAHTALGWQPEYSGEEAIRAAAEWFRSSASLSRRSRSLRG